jgi:hypothetical protein
MLATETGLKVRGKKDSRSRRHRRDEDKTNLFGQSEFRTRAPPGPRSGFGFSGFSSNHRKSCFVLPIAQPVFFPAPHYCIAHDSQSFVPVFTVPRVDSGLLRLGRGRGRKDRRQIRFQPRQGGGGLYPGAAGGGVHEGARLRFRPGHGAHRRRPGRRRCLAGRIRHQRPAVFLFGRRAGRKLPHYGDAGRRGWRVGQHHQGRVAPADAGESDNGDRPVCDLHLHRERAPATRRAAITSS